MSFYSLNFENYQDSENVQDINGFDFDNVTEEDDLNTSADSSSSDQSGFTHPFIFIVSTVRMMLADFAAVKVTDNDRFQETLLLLFMLFISVVLLNLFNALAISDTNEVMKVAEFVEIEKRISTIQNYERLFLFLKISILNFFPKTTSIMLEPNKDLLLKVRNDKRKTRVSGSNLIRDEKFKPLRNESVLFWRGKYVEFDEKFMKKVLDFVKNQTVLLEAKTNRKKDETNQKAYFEELLTLIEALKNFERKIEKKLEEINKTLSCEFLKNKKATDESSAVFEENTLIVL